MYVRQLAARDRLPECMTLGGGVIINMWTSERENLTFTMCRRRVMLERLNFLSALLDSPNRDLEDTVGICPPKSDNR